MHFSEEVRQIAGAIGDFYLRKNKGDYDATQADIEKLRIANISILTDGSVLIETERPGILIGRRGTNIEELTAFLARNIRIKEVEGILPLIVPLNPNDYE